MRVRDGPAAVRGDAPRRTATGRRAGKAAQEGAPSQKTCRSPPNPNPSRKEDSCHRRLFIFARRPRGGAARSSPRRSPLRVHVRVEGKTRTIFGPTEPALSVNANALDALDSASLAGEFYYHVTIALVRPVRRPDRPLRGRRLERLGLQGERRLAARRRRRGHAQGRRPRALVLGHLRPERAGRRRSVLQPRRSAAATACWPRTTPARRRPRAERGCTSAAAACSPAPARRASAAHRGLVTATLKGAVRSNALR